MSTPVLMDVDEYLRTGFEGPDCEYLDGEIVERNTGDLRHGTVQGTLVSLLKKMEQQLRLRVVPETRIRIHSRRYRVADIGLWRAGKIGERIPTQHPFLVIEIYSREDRIVRMQPKIQEYFPIGVEWVWLIDPEERKAICYSRENPTGALCDVLKTENPKMEIPLGSVLEPEQ